MKAQRKRWMTTALAVRNVGTIAVVTLVTWALADIAQGATVTWNGSGDMTWTQPDNNSFSATYNSGDTAVFGAAGVGTVTIAPGGVTPGGITLNTSGYTFALGGSDALGTCSIDNGVFNSTSTFTNTTGSVVSLANNFSYGNLYMLKFTGGDFHLTGTVNSGGNGGPKFMPDAGVTLTLDHGIAGMSDFSIQPLGAGATVYILGASGGGLYSVAGNPVTIKIGADNAIGPSGYLVSESQPITFEAYGGARKLDNKLFSRGFTVQGTNDLTMNGAIQNNEGYHVYKQGSSTWTVNGSNSAWGNILHLREGVIRCGSTNALGTCGLWLAGGVLELASGDFSWPLSSNPGNNSSTVGWKTDGSYGASGGFSAYGTNRVVNLGGTGTTLTWNSTPGFVPNGQTLIFGSSSANAQLDFQNPINLNNAVREIRANDNTNSTADQALISGVITNGGLLKTGAGKLVLSAANTYTGATTVSNGTLVVNGTLASTNVPVNPLGTLGGTGTLSGAVNLDSGATIAPGDPTGTLTVASLTASSGAVWMVSVQSDGSCGTLATTGALDITNVQLVATGTMPPSGYVVLAQGNPLTGPFQSVSLPPRSGIVYVGNEVRLRVVTKGLVLAVQ